MGLALQKRKAVSRHFMTTKVEMIRFTSWDISLIIVGSMSSASSALSHLLTVETRDKMGTEERL